MRDASWPEVRHDVMIVKHDIRRITLMPSTLEIGSP